MLKGGFPVQLGSSLMASDRAESIFWLNRRWGSQDSAVRCPMTQTVPPPGWLSRPASCDPASGGGVWLAADSSQISAMVALPPLVARSSVTGFFDVPGAGLTWSATSGMIIRTARVQPGQISAGLCQMVKCRDPYGASVPAAFPSAVKPCCHEPDW
jgi:hypothetical protein